MVAVRSRIAMEAHRVARHASREQDACAPMILPYEGGEGMSILAWIVLGLVAGALAKAVMPGDDPGGIIITILIGIVGAVIGGFLWSFITGTTTYTQLDLGGILIAVLGAIVLLAVYRMVTGRRTT